MLHQRYKKDSMNYSYQYYYEYYYIVRIVCVTCSEVIKLSYNIYLLFFGSSSLEVFYKIAFLKENTHVCNFFIKDLRHRCFPVNFAKYLKSDSHLPNKFLFICFNESPLKTMKNASDLILKALFVLKIF